MSSGAVFVIASSNKPSKMLAPPLYASVGHSFVLCELCGLCGYCLLVDGAPVANATVMASIRLVIDGPGGPAGGFETGVIRGGPSRPNQAGIRVTDANVDDVKIVAQRPQ